MNSNPQSKNPQRENPRPLLPLVLDDVPPGLRVAMEQDGVPHDTRPCGAHSKSDSRHEGRFVLFDSRRDAHPRLDVGQSALDVAPCLLATTQSADSFAGDMAEMLIDQRPAARQWRIGPLSPEEQVAAVDKAVVRRAVISRLRSIVEAAGGVWATLAPVPAPYQSAFCLRVDYDEVAPRDISRFLNAIKNHGQATSHYICASAYPRQAELLDRLSDLHVGGHGFWHHTYADADENRRNIKRGLDALAAAGFEPDGFVAPHGRFNAGLVEVLEELGLSHSSEFALAYDDRPFLPLLANGRRSDVLQIPVHPISFGVLLEAAKGFDDQTGDKIAQLAVAHYSNWLAACARAGEPAFFYGHPEGRLGRYPQIVAELFRAADAVAGLWQTSLREFGRWWRERSLVEVRMFHSEGRWRIECDNVPGDRTPVLQIRRGDGLAELPLDRPRLELASLDDLSFRGPGPPPTLAGLPAEEPKSWKAAFRSFIDWELATPTREIRVRNLRQLLKKSLRYALRKRTLSTGDVAKSSTISPTSSSNDQGEQA